ncbi:hypothetical protein PO124_18920 [Bacillus licheniformis]|nr:hypothetical protein [Bacillus licheniformis]
MQGDPDHPVTQGNICNKVRNMTERIYDPKRLKTPLKRTGPKEPGCLNRSAGMKRLKRFAPAGSRSLNRKAPKAFCPTAFTEIWET